MSTKIRLYDVVCRQGRIDHKRLIEFAEEVACSITENQEEQKWYIRFLMVATHYVFAECNIHEKTFLSLLKLAKASEKDDDYESSTFDIMLSELDEYGEHKDIVMQLKKEYRWIANTRPPQAEEKLEKAFLEYQNSHEINIFGNNLFNNALELFESFCRGHSTLHGVNDFETAYQYISDAVRIANEHNFLSEEGCREMLRKLDKIHEEERPINYEVMKITDTEGSVREDGHYPLRVGRILKPTHEFCVGETANWIWLTHQTCRNSRFHTSIVQKIVTDRDGIELHTLNSIYYLKKI